MISQNSFGSSQDLSEPLYIGLNFSSYRQGLVRIPSGAERISKNSLRKWVERVRVPVEAGRIGQKSFKSTQDLSEFTQKHSGLFRISLGALDWFEFLWGHAGLKIIPSGANNWSEFLLEPAGLDRIPLETLRMHVNVTCTLILISFPVSHPSIKRLQGWDEAGGS